ncbi:MAG TPA: phytoene/squalene synthase family protein [Gemmatimonadaceae bacterium]
MGLGKSYLSDVGRAAQPSSAHGESDAGQFDARICRRITAHHARTFWLAARLLPPAKRRGAFALYATCRTADDMVDSGRSRDQAARTLAQFRSDVFRALEIPSASPVLRELAWAWHTWQVPYEYLEELFAGLERDLTDGGYASWADLAAYCEGVAGSVGAMCCTIFGSAAGDALEVQAVRCARVLGVAMQLTNILRDIGEDAGRGRCYIPTEDLRRYGFSAGDVLSGAVRARWPEWRRLMAFEIARARSLYRQAEPGFPLLDADARRCAVACATGYASILDAIEAADGDTLSRRVVASRRTLLGAAWRAWRGELPAASANQAEG